MKMNYFTAERIGLVDKTIRREAEQMRLAARVARDNGLPVATAIEKKKTAAEHRLTVISRCFKKHGYDRTTRKLLERIAK